MSAKAKKEKKEKIKNKKFGRVPPEKIISSISIFVILALLAFTYYWVTNDRYNKPASNINIEKFQSFDFCNDLKLHMVDVGQGDAVIIQLPSNQIFLIDCGNVQYEDKLVDYIKNILKVNYIDFLLITHPDIDHIGSVERIFKEFDVGYVFRPYIKYSNPSNNQTTLLSGINEGATPKDFENNKIYYNFLKALANENCGYEFFNKDSDIQFELQNNGNKIPLKIDFLTPTSPVKDIYYENTNNFSPLVMIDFNGFKILLTGDAEEIVENEFLSYYENEYLYYDMNIFKVAHHGSMDSSSQKFLEFTKPEYALISCGENNSYGHPHKETLDNLFYYSKSVVYRTDKNGTITVKITPNGEFEFTTEKGKGTHF